VNIWARKVSARRGVVPAARTAKTARTASVLEDGDILMGSLRDRFGLYDYDAQKAAAKSNGYFLTVARTICSSSIERTWS
jgi:hypothetical protein